jgi:hypothetical protein
LQYVTLPPRSLPLHQMYVSTLDDAAAPGTVLTGG